MRDADKYFKKNGMIFRKTKRGRTIYTRVTISDPRLVAYLELVKEKTDRPLAQILGSFIQDAFNSGLVPKY